MKNQTDLLLNLWDTEVNVSKSKLNLNLFVFIVRPFAGLHKNAAFIRTNIWGESVVVLETVRDREVISGKCS